MPAGRPLFTVAGRTYAWEDVLIAAELRGELATLERQTRQGLACLRRLAAEPDALAPEALRAAAAAFRHEHNLLAADELDAWLAARSLTVADWNAYLRRLLLRDLWAAELDRIESLLAVGAEEVEKALPAEASCTGFLRRAAERLAEDAALIAADDAVDDAGDRTAFIAALTREAEVVRARPRTWSTSSARSRLTRSTGSASRPRRSSSPTPRRLVRPRSASASTAARSPTSPATPACLRASSCSTWKMRSRSCGPRS